MHAENNPSLEIQGNTIQEIACTPKVFIQLSGFCYET